MVKKASRGGGPRLDRLDTARRATKYLSDGAFVRSLPKHADGTSPVVVASWDDRVGDLFARLDENGLPATVILPRGESAVWFFSVKESEVEDKFARPVTSDMLLRELVSHIWEHGSVHVRLAEPVPAEWELGLELAA